MKIQVEYKDKKGIISNMSLQMTRTALIKHMAMAGQGYELSPKKLFRTLGMFLHYCSYIHRVDFQNNRFSEPHMQLSDPTEKGQFSNLAGKAIADFLSKKIDNSLYTVNYEAAMRVKEFPITGKRPDLIAYSPKSVFAIEAKGKSENNPGDMSKYKSQAQAGPISVNYSVACISYNLYNKVECKYHDPPNNNVEYDNVSLQSLTRAYYKELVEFLHNDLFEHSMKQYNGEYFYEIDLFSCKCIYYFPCYELFNFYRPILILPKNIEEYAKNGITNEIKSFSFDSIETTDGRNDIYIDNDRVGIRIK